MSECDQEEGSREEEVGGVVVPGTRSPGGHRHKVMQSTPQDQHRRSSYAALACIFLDDLELGSSGSMANMPQHLDRPMGHVGEYVLTM